MTLLQMDMSDRPAAVESDAANSLQWLLRSVISASNDILNLTVGDVSSSAEDLGRYFTQLTDSAETQTGVLNSIVSRSSQVELDGKAMELVDLPVTIKQSMEEVSGKVATLSRQGLGLISSLDDILREVSHLDECIHDIEGINRQARLLSLNAQIESARAGDSASGFQIVSMEMLEVSKRIDALSKTMLSSSQVVKNSIQNVIDSIRNEFNELSQIGSMESSEQVQAHKGLEMLMETLVNQNLSMHEAVEDSARNSQQLTDDIRGIVVSMQFQDRMKQRADAVIEALNTLSRYLDENASSLHEGESIERIAQEIVGGITLSEVRETFEVSLYGTSSTTSSDDDIELF